VARLDATDRASLPDRAFAYIDSRGRRRLPIHDEAHVRNALARFGQVAFEDERARERARRRLLNAAKKYGIVPVGFIAGQLLSERELGEKWAGDPARLPSGFLTLLMTDVEGSTDLVRRLGGRYHELIAEARTILGEAVAAFDGHVVEARADEFFAVFEHPGSALSMAVTTQREFRGRSWVDDVDVRVRVGMHSGRPTLSAPNYIGLAVHTAARICAVAHGGQVVVSGATRDAVRGATPDGVRLRSLGEHRLRGLPEAVPLFQVAAKGLAARFPPLRASTNG
jgi:class 3 adenylate cyclase